MALYTGSQCPCPTDCKRRGDCKACIAFHHQRGDLTYCEHLEARQGAFPDQAPAPQGRQIRLMDYGACAG